MTRTVITAGILGLSVANITGCASAPPAGELMPAGDTPRKPAAPVKDAEGKHRYALALMAQEDWHGAAAELETLTAARPGLPGPWVNLGITRTMLGDSTGAENAFKRALDASDSHAEAWNQLGMLYRRSGRIDEARFAYESGLKHAPQHAYLHWNLGILFEKYLSNPALALAHYERYRELSGEDDPQLQHWIVELRKQVPVPETMKAETKK